MIPLLLWIIVLIVALFFLIKSADYFTDSAEKIGLHLGMTPFLVGVTIVALGTSIPELATSIVSIFRNSSEIVIGNVMGSNIANIMLVLGFGVVIAKRIKLKKGLSRIDKVFLALTAVLLFVFAYNKQIDMWESITFIILYIAYVTLSFRNNKSNEKKKHKLKWEPIILVISAAAIYFSAEYTIKAIISLSEIMGFGKEVIAASAVAFGTSLPELAVSLTAIKRGNFELAIGNLLGSNIFNISMVLGITGLFSVLPITPIMATLGMFVMLLATGLFMFALKDNTIQRWEGIILLAIYVLYIAKLFNVL